MTKLKVGDKVRVLRKAKSFELGWTNSWVPDRMDAFVGKVGTVKYVDGQKDSADVTIDFGSDENWGFPAFVLEKQGMKILNIKRSTQKTGLKIYGKILGESGKTYNFAYIRRPNFRGWICSCENFFFDMFKKSRNCKHLHFVRNEVGRFGTKVPKS